MIPSRRGILYKSSVADITESSLIFASNDRRADGQHFSWVYILCWANMKFVFDSEERLETYAASFIGEEEYGRAVVDSLGITRAGPYHVASGFCT